MTVPTLSFAARPPAGALAVDLESLGEGRLLINASSGGGKSTLLRHLLEETHGRVQHIVIDPEGEFATLRKAFDYLLVARHGGDVAADPRHARLLCRRVMEIGASVILDIFDLKPHERVEYVRLFLEELMVLPRSLWHPTLVVLDEAHMFAPEPKYGSASSTPAVIDVGSRGRKRGYYLICATTRIAKLNKDAAEVANRLIGRTGLDVDVRRAGDELGFEKEQRVGLRRLAQGEFYAYGPAFTVEPTLVRSVHPDRLRTKAPPRGAATAPPPPAPAKIRGLVQQLADLPKEAEEEARTLDDLRRQNAELQRKVRAAERGAPERIVEKPVADPRAIERAVQAAVGPLRSEYERVVRIAGVAVDAIDQQVNGLRDRLAQSRQRMDTGAGVRETSRAGTSDVGPKEREAVRNTVAPAAPAPRAPSRPVALPPEGLQPSEAKILNALALMDRIGVPGLRVNLGFFAGYAASAGRFNNLVGGLRTKGLVDYPRDGEVALTDDGRALADADAGAIQSVADLHALWLSKLDPSEAKVLRAVLDAHPDTLTRDELAARTDYVVAGRFNNIVGHLKTLGAIEYPTKGSVRASSALYPEGLR